MKHFACIVVLALVCAASASYSGWSSGGWSSGWPSSGWSSGWSSPAVYSAPLVYTRRVYPSYSYGGYGGHGGWSGWSNKGWW